MEIENKHDAFIFTHIPKCGGVSFRNFINTCAIDSNIDPSLLYIPGENGIHTKQNIKTLDQEQLRDLATKEIKVIADHSKYDVHHTAGLTKIKSPLYFSVFREPISRFISHYNYFYRDQNYSNCGGKEFSQLPRHKKIKILHALENLQVTYLVPHKKNRNCNKNDFLFAINILENGNMIFGLLEEMKSTIQVLKSLGPNWLEWNKEFPFLNKARKKEYNINPEDLKLIRAYHKFDLKLYEYAQHKLKILEILNSLK